MADSFLKLGDLSAEEVFTKLQTQGLGAAEASTLVADWILANTGNARQVFEYQTPFPEEEQDCAPKFVRSFHHSDWIDGESVVQAEQTTNEEGFNHRLHAIEADLEALAADTAKVFLCVAEMRKNIFSLLAEIRTAINQLNDAVFALKGPGQPSQTGPVIDRFAGPQSATFLGATKYFDKDVNVWNTSQGIMMLPVVNPSPVTVTNDPRVGRPSMLAKYVVEHPAVVNAFAGGPVTKEQMVARFGDQIIAGATTVQEAVNILPAGSSFNTVDDMVNAVATAEAAAIRTTAGAPQDVAATFGVGKDVTSVAAAPIERFDLVPATAVSALKASGLDTMEKLASADTNTVAAALDKAGIAGSAGQAAALKIAATTLVNVHA